MTLWLVPSSLSGLTVRGPFDGLGLRGNASSPVTAEGVRIGGYDAVQKLQIEMDEGRQHRLIRLGFTAAEAVEISALHTRNFMQRIGVRGGDEPPER